MRPFAAVLLFSALCFAGGPKYAGKPYEGKPQVIPGTLQLALYDTGGEGVAYHDTDASNNGSKLNHTSFQSNGAEVKHCQPGVAERICFFRENEGMDISYTKTFADFRPGVNMVDPPHQQLYLGWTEDGEWTRYTVDVKQAGRYEVIALYSNQANTFQLEIDGAPAGDYHLPVATNDFHRWNKGKVGEIVFPRKGRHVVTLRYGKGNNYATFEFVPVKP